MIESKRIWDTHVMFETFMNDLLAPQINGLVSI